MAGRIFPIALATISGIAIGTATFGEELKSQRMKRLTEEYNQYVAHTMDTCIPATTDSDLQGTRRRCRCEQREPSSHRAYCSGNDRHATTRSCTTTSQSGDQACCQLMD
jgi:hypothetical protein